MNDDAIPEFCIQVPNAELRSRPVTSDEMAALCAKAGGKDITLRGHYDTPHHPNCGDCCAVGRCHWCLNRPQAGTITSTGPDGFVYAACTAHHRYFSEMKHRAHPHAGVDLTSGLQSVDISTLSPLVR